jgi:AcrR family transcriptional regulator
MSTKNLTMLSERRNDLTRSVIMDAAIDMLEQTSVSELTVRGVAQQANISERTVFRYFPSRDALLDAVAKEVLARMDLPPPPSSLEQLLGSARALYCAFEARAELARTALHTDLVQRIRNLQGEARWNAVSTLIDELAPRKSARERKIASANICFHLAASTWHYYRYSFSFSLEDCIACAETAVRQALDEISGRR